MEPFKVLVIVLVACISISQAASTNPPVQGLFVFGDSALDGGQNTYIPGSKIVSAIPPYGKTYFSKPTGRWTDGRTIADFLAQALGLPLLPPFLEPGANFSSGVNFASAGAGLLDETNAHQGVISMKQQLRQFHNVTNEYKKEKGVEFTNQLLRNSVALFSMGANDIANAVPSSFLFQEMIQAYSSAIQVKQMLLLIVNVKAHGGKLEPRRFYSLSYGCELEPASMREFEGKHA
ncbi:GDSL esterase/lipase 6 [Selaginella moellendorffii]|uniref:GDSL esterase/lipase 6 n=1 Tax=Selaginella moellendorffii TaxID=88036 RepID=UPI000D1CA8B8|nr:GDSL esterase/lipase 6 [Selaginella moellendorffii]|eukprot:XP_024533553.1 GDSL esterase/lipase 6 [Selaginella moellendorffii]